MTANATFAARLTWAIERSGYTKKEIADMAGISTMTLAHYLAGRREPTRKNLDKLHQALRGVLDGDLGWLVSGY